MTAPGDDSTDVTDVSVTGGPGGLTANRDAIAHLAGVHRSEAAALDCTSWTLGHEGRALGPGVAPGDYGAAGMHDLAGLLRARAALDEAAGLLARAAHETATLGTKLVWATRGYPWGTDALDKGLLDQLDGLTGLVAGVRADPIAGQDPKTVDLLVGVVGVPELSTLAAADDDGPGIAVALGTASAAAPRGLADVIAGLGEVDRSGTPGGIDVRIVVDAYGRRRAIVDITGTRVWRHGGRDPADLKTNALAMTGRPSAYSRGVLAALRDAGVRSDEPVMLVGHSQGGMVAVTAAAEAARTGEFTVTHVVTAGSPVGLSVARLPPTVRVLALENSRDLVPRLDGAANPDRRNVTTVSAPAGDGSVGGAHEIDKVYRPLAEAAERTGGRSVRDFLGSAGGYFDGVRVEQHSYRVERR